MVATAFNTHTSARISTHSMSVTCRDEAIALFAPLWANDSPRWNQGQLKVAAGVYELFSEITTITHIDLMKRIDQILTANPRAYKADKEEKTSTGSRSGLLPCYLALM